MLGVLGEGGSGKVFEARHVDTGELVALKQLRRARPDALARFKQEFRALQDLHHPNLVSLRGLLESDGQWFIAMELLEGTDWLSWVRPGADNHNGPVFDLERIQATLPGISAGLLALHRDGFIHRDLKPDNIWVTRDGNPVLLDFGLLTAADGDAQITGEAGYGTVAYMAPEQAAGRKVGPSADWYALGASLYEALTGELPVTGNSVLQVVVNKQDHVPLPPSQLDPMVPEELDRVCMGLLAIDPEARADGTAIRRLLRDTPEPRRDTAMAPAMGAPFAGRVSELDLLRRKFEAALEGTPQQLVVQGESGVGKSALVEEFLRRLEVQHPQALVLRGRCYENESVPFKGFDGVVDSLAHYLRKLPESACKTVLPPRAKVLEQMFTVMGQVTALASRSMRGVPADPSARRSTALDTLCELFTNLRAERPIVIIVDDVQWADAESFNIFEALTNQRHGPPLLMLFTVRPSAELAEDLAAPLAALCAGPNADVLPLRGLPPAQARELVAHLLGPTVPGQFLEQIARESQGHPLFVAELVQFLRNGDGLESLGAISLESVLAARVGALSAEELHLLRLVALAASPKKEEALYEASPSDVEWPRVLARLRALRFVRSGARGRVLCYHDRVRRAVVAGMEPAEATALHLSLARALATQKTREPAEVGFHFECGGDPTSAVHWLLEGADRALEELSFAQAEQLYARCLQLAVEIPAEQRCRLLVGRGHAMARIGRSAEAAAIYQQAAPLADDSLSIRLRVWAAEHLLQSAQTEEGLRAAEAVLRDLGVYVPGSNAAAMTRMMFDSMRLRLRGQQVEGTPGALAGKERLALDALMALSGPVGTASLLTGYALTTQHLVRALSAGDVGHAARALAQQAIGKTFQKPGNYESCGPVFERAGKLAADSGDPAHQAFVLFCRAAAGALAADLEGAEPVIEEAERLLLEHCPAERFLLTSVRASRSTLWGMRGEHRLIAQHTSEWIRDAERRGDTYAHAEMVGTGHGFIRQLAQDCPERALEELHDAMSRRPEEPFSYSHVGEMLAATAVRLYRGGDEAWQWHMQHKKRLDGGLLLLSGVGKASRLTLRAQAALAARCAGEDTRKHSALMSVLRKDLRWVLNSPWTPTRILATVLRAQYHILLDRGEEAQADIHAALEACEQTGIVGALPAARFVEGVLLGGVAGKRLRKEAQRSFEDQGYANPMAALRTWGVPALDALL